MDGPPDRCRGFLKLITAKDFRRWVLRPAEGVFLFHPRAMERLLRPPTGEGPARVPGGMVYHLIPRQTFLSRLELENPEALSVIEGLRLPELVLLLPMPADAVLRTTAARTLLRDFWARRFEGELARAWQAARDDNQDQERFGPDVLARMIGATGLAEALDVLIRDGVPGAGEGTTALCRAFVARTVRLRYFAPGTRGCHFPAVPDWGSIDDWLEESGLDLPPPHSGTRLPLLLERSRPSGPCAPPAFLVQWPQDLPGGGADPDRVPQAQTQCPERIVQVGDTRVSGSQPPATGTTATDLASLESLCLDTLRHAATIRQRPGLFALLVQRLIGLSRVPLVGFMHLWAFLSDRTATRKRAGIWELRLRLHLLGTSFRIAHNAERDGRYATALRHLDLAQQQYRRLCPDHTQDSPSARMIAGHQESAAESLAHALAIAGRLPLVEAAGLPEQIRRLATASGPDRSTALNLLNHLQRALFTGEATYYRLNLRGWLATGRVRQVLPFQGILKELRALDSARRLVEELSWPAPDLDRLTHPIAVTAARLQRQLHRQIAPLVQQALDRAGFLSTTARERIAMQQLADGLTGLVLTRWQLRFSDVRDLLARDSLGLPDATLRDLLRGDLLSRFDQAAVLALPGVYRRGEPYVKGLQRLGAPLFGTGAGRLILRLVLGPWLVAYLGLVMLSVVWDLLATDSPPPAWTDPALVLPLATLISLMAGTRIGRRLARSLWLGLTWTWYYLLGPGLLRLLRHIRLRVRYWGPTAWVLELRLVRVFLDRLLAPLITGLVPVLPFVVPLLLVTPEELEASLWINLTAAAFVVGTLLRDTPAGRLWLDNLISGWQRFWSRLRHEGLADLAAAVMGFFSAQTRRLTEGLHRVRGLLDRRLHEPWPEALLKTLTVPIWAVIEALIQFYAVVLVEPQTNPIKHFPVVTVGHKLMLPLLPAITHWSTTLLSPFLPTTVLLPLVALTVFLLPGLFGFLFWELKENWKLYAANRVIPVPPARLGDHGDTVRDLMRRGFHGGTLPKSFDRLRLVLERQVRSGTPNPRELRQVARTLEGVSAALTHFVTQDLALPLRDGCPNVLRRPTIGPPRLATQAVDLHLSLTPACGTAPLALRIRLSLRDSILKCEAQLQGPCDLLPETCLSSIRDATDWFARRCGAQPSELIRG